jgi:hypothetical protein
MRRRTSVLQSFSSMLLAVMLLAVEVPAETAPTGRR